ncbi:MAG: YbaB/EbfC family nucleoid-associated protein [Chloroflexi bacterium]|nr:YbaB/EbfC family nucleoid-associated protein [Chloroflexota bacterium]
MVKRKRSPRGYRSPGSRGGASPKGGGDMLAQLKQMQEQMEAAQQALAEEKVEISVGGGVVTVVANGQQEVLSITIAPDVVDPEDVEMLQDLVLAAVNEALDRSRELASERMGGLTAGLDLPPGLL